LELAINISFTRYVIAFTAIMFGRNILEIFTKPKSSGKSRYDTKDKLTLLVFLLTYLASALAAAIYLLTDITINPVTFLAGTIIQAAGCAGRMIALRKISSSYSQSMIPGKDAVLVTDGFYSRIRHPLYSFYALEMLGILLIRFNWISLAMLAADLVNTAYRINREETLLTEKHGVRYEEYRKRTKRLIPFIF
jgi:protein-S-isoprenylcysteine O-methyltransferase Ste14